MRDMKKRLLACVTGAGLALALAFPAAAATWIPGHHRPNGVWVPGHWVGGPGVWIPGHYGPAGYWIPGHWRGGHGPRPGPFEAPPPGPVPYGHHWVAGYFAPGGVWIHGYWAVN